MKSIVALAVAAGSLLAAAPAFASPECTKEPKDKWLSDGAMKAKATELGYKAEVFKVEGNCYEIYGYNKLLEHQYPGNVRELENVIERSISFANTSEILPADLPPDLRHVRPTPKVRASSQRLKDALLAVEKDTITAALLESGGNISRAAAILGIYRQQLQRKIKQHKIAV